MQTSLTLLLKGFQVFEQRIIETTARLSKSRSPQLFLSPSDSPSNVEVIIIDGTDEDAMQWATENRQSFGDKTVIWIDTDPMDNNPKHSRMNRPVLWVNLPIILTRILEEQELKEAEAELKQSPQATNRNNVDQGAAVLVVDDSQAVREYLVKILNENGYSVTAAEDGEVAIEAAQSKYFDCVLMDVLMPGIDGYKACRQIRRIKQHKKTMSVVMLTSRTSPFDKIRGKMAGCDDYLTKPVKIETLLKTVTKHTKK